MKLAQSQFHAGALNLLDFRQVQDERRGGGGGLCFHPERQLLALLIEGFRPLQIESRGVKTPARGGSLLLHQFSKHGSIHFRGSLQVGNAGGQFCNDVSGDSVHGASVSEECRPVRQFRQMPLRPGPFLARDPMTPPENIGLYGGSFDPVHHGHLILARDAVEQLGLSRLIFIPAAVSPHKLTRAPGAPGDWRLRMLQAAVAGEPRFSVDPCELHRAGPSYTVDTILALRARHAPGTTFFYLIGEDNVPLLHTWHRSDELRALVRFVVCRRHAPNLPPSTLPPPSAADSTGFPVLTRWVDISSTEIRNRVASGQPIRYLVPESVATIIDAQSLYRPTTQGE